MHCTAYLYHFTLSNNFWPITVSWTLFSPNKVSTQRCITVSYYSFRIRFGCNNRGLFMTKCYQIHKILLLAPMSAFGVWTTECVSAHMQNSASVLSVVSEVVVVKHFPARHITSFFSFSLVIMTMAGDSSCQAICQKSFTVFTMGPWVAMNAFSSPR